MLRNGQNKKQDQLYPGEKIKIGKHSNIYNILLNQQLLLWEFVKFEFPWSHNKQCRTFVNTLLKWMSTKCKLGDFNLIYWIIPWPLLLIDDMASVKLSHRECIDLSDLCCYNWHGLPVTQGSRTLSKCVLNNVNSIDI